ncbi:hypothetical protein [Tessaracoccus lapidicaptus]|uniref:hypothetical protein n=1 Tax=Tessaracoccus lapidicaptus TaxID=1427523 RepID=UPI0033425E9F
MRRPSSVLPAAVLISMVGLSPTAAALELAPDPAASGAPSPADGTHQEGHSHQDAPASPTAIATAAPPTTAPATPLEPSGDDHEGGGHGAETEQHRAEADEHEAAREHGDTADPVDRPRALVFGGFGLVNGAVMLWAALLRRRTAPDHSRRRAARAAALAAVTPKGDVR